MDNEMKEMQTERLEKLERFEQLEKLEKMEKLELMELAAQRLEKLEAGGGEADRGYGLSRRKLLMSLGAAGAATMAGMLLNGGAGIAYAATKDKEKEKEKEKDKKKLIEEHGAPCLDDIPALLAFSRGSNTCALVSDPLRGGIFSWGASGTANGGTVFNALGGGVWLRQFSGSFNVCWFGAKTFTDSTAAIQAAFNAITRPGSIYIPGGVYTISAVINLPQQVVSISGDGQYVTYLIAVSPNVLHTMFKGTTNDTMEIKDLSFDGNAVADSAVYFDMVTHSTFSNLFITGTRVEALHVNGYNNSFFRCQIVSNYGDGLVSYGTPNYNNNVNVLSTDIYSNGGIGLRIGNGLNVNVSHSTIEKNAKAGIIAYDLKNVNIVECYFERNAQVGMSYTDAQNPTAVNVKSDIHLLGGGGITIGIDPAKPVECVKVSGIHWTPLNSEGVDNGGVNNTSFVFSNYLDKLTIESVQVYDNSKADSLLTIWGNGNTSIIKGDVILRANSRYDVKLIGVDAGLAVSGGHYIESTAARTKNYYDGNFPAYSRIAGTSGDLLKSQQRLDGYPAFELTAGTEWWGQPIAGITTKYPELPGTLVWFGAWVKADSGNDVKVVSYDGTNSHADTLTAAGSGQWQFKSILVPVSATAAQLVCAFQRLGSGGNGKVAFPVLAQAGASLNRFEIGTEADFHLPSIPAVGYWELGETVKNASPAPGSAFGWICTAAGAPGTWKAFGKIEI
ncbi:right-handed parallel beta-helix repeat-containing protein [Paenibacillus eucommiae]|uniref:Right handed beta helix domain-containing protein n=1 Tax=Paenibacillus eucommiae TaxID=1355755 RepID=A0ABS4IWY7_9BACL|nr:right-handed parallel beta-helix repeat-containing protein [Paenibacillus eucommiae]MBP1992089.1 hypothetical protein [Paenibacillus eucommiae]